MEQETGQTTSTIGIGTPGTIDPLTDKLKNSTNTLCLNNKQINKDLEKILGKSVK